MAEDTRNSIIFTLLGIVLGALGSGTVLHYFQVEDFSSATMVFATAIIAIFTMALAFSQFVSSKHQIAVSRANYSVSLHNKRTETFHAAEIYLTHIRFGVTTEKSTRDSARKLIATAEFIFPPSTSEFLKQLIRKCDDYELTSLRYERYVSRQNRNTAIEREMDKCIERLDELDRWFAEHGTVQRLKSELGPHLTLPPSI